MLTHLLWCFVGHLVGWGVLGVFGFFCSGGMFEVCLVEGFKQAPQPEGGCVVVFCVVCMLTFPPRERRDR